MAADVPMYLISTGDYLGALMWVLNSYMPYGIVWILVGVMVYGVTYQKSRSMAVVTVIFALFLAITGLYLPLEVQFYYSLLVGVSLFAVVYRIMR